MSPTAEQTKLLSIYLEDHVAGATAGSQRAARLADAEADTKDADVLAHSPRTLQRISMHCWR